MTKLSPSNEDKAISDILPCDIFESDIFFIGRNILKHFIDFYNRRFSISLQK